MHNTVSGIKEAMKAYDDRAFVDETDLSAALGAGFMCVTGLAMLVTDQFGSDSANLTALEREGQRVFRELRPEQQKLGRNDPCWCGSGKKLKNCHEL